MPGSRAGAAFSNPFAPRAARLLQAPRHPISDLWQMLVIRKANGAEFLKDHLQARLEVGLQKRRQPGTGRASIGFLLFVSFSAFRGCFTFSNTSP